MPSHASTRAAPTACARRDDGLDYIEVATTRPETMLADMAVGAINVA